jgi:hypothetical protein
MGNDNNNGMMMIAMYNKTQQSAKEYNILVVVV